MTLVMCKEGIILNRHVASTVKVDFTKGQTSRHFASVLTATLILLISSISVISIGNLDNNSNLLTSAEAQQGEQPTIQIPEGAAAQTVDTYYIPETAQVQGGSEVTWVNEDTAPHTSTSGTPVDGPSGLFDTGIIEPGASASVTITSEAGTTIPYYCTLHPWMTATLSVISADGQEQPPAQQPPTAVQPFSLSTELEGESYTINGTAAPELNATSFTINPGQSIEVEFQGETAAGSVNLTIPNVVVENVTAVTAAQTGENITFTVVEQTPNATTIGFEVPQDVAAVEISGISVVPEFQTIALLILGASVFATIAFTRLKTQNNANNASQQGLFGGGI